MLIYLSLIFCPESKVKLCHCREVIWLELCLLPSSQIINGHRHARQHELPLFSRPRRSECWNLGQFPNYDIRKFNISIDKHSSYIQQRGERCQDAGESGEQGQGIRDILAELFVAIQLGGPKLSTYTVTLKILRSLTWIPSLAWKT